MYGAVPAAARAWRALFARIFADVKLDVRFMEHRFPQPIEALWRTPGLCCDFMCGWPFIRSKIGMQAIAAPVPAPPRYAGLPRYCSEFLVREESGWTSIEQTFGHRIGWMANDSQSGFNAPRALLAKHVTSARQVLYRESLGPYVTPGRLLDALQRREIDVVALDSYFLDLCRRHDPARLMLLRPVALTPWTPIPLLVAAPDVPRVIVEQLRAHVLGIRASPAYAPLLADVLLEGFDAPQLDSYEELEAMAQFATEQGYELIR
jgi:ABC-type phosphate/phosphonate transport system substrate-binding protein